MQGVNRGGKGHTMPRTNYWGVPKSSDNDASIFFSTVHLLPKILHGGAMKPPGTPLLGYYTCLHGRRKGDKGSLALLDFENFSKKKLYS